MITSSKPLLIVGQGIAGSILSWRLHLLGIPFLIVDQPQDVLASRVASGIYNPIVLKRMNPVWNAKLMMEGLVRFYDEMASALNSNFHHNLPIARLFASVEEQNNWIAACENEVMGAYLHPEIIDQINEWLNVPFGIGLVKGCGRVDTEAMMQAITDFWVAKRCYKKGTVEVDQIIEIPEGIIWDNRLFSAVVFCSGHRALKQVHSSISSGFALTKGEVMEIACFDLKLDTILNAGVFILPLGDHRYKVGATYSWNPKDETPTADKLFFLKSQLEKVLKAPYQVFKHEAGIRPTMKDRKPLLGLLPGKKRQYIFNGLGSRGILMAPWLSSLLIEQILQGSEIPGLIDVNRFFYQD
jgi:glycine oxidase